ncbi:MAG: hypothetical protein NXI04_08870 [Planctomycetaceae bacterium]|nr:hypothetical protein [Planctomycetaceae bacterium]
MFQALSRSARHFATAVLLLLLLLGLAEVGLRVSAPPRAATVASVAAGQLQSLLVPSATSHHEMVRLSTVVCETGVPIQTNSLGLRGPMPDSDLPADMPRILVLGDETILGPQLNDEETVPARLQQLLEKNGVAAEVINGGVPGYSPLLSWLLYHHELQRLQPDFVILHFDMTDVADDAFYRPALKSQGDERVCCHSVLQTTPQSPGLLVDLVRSSAVAGWVQQAAGLDGGARTKDRTWLRERYQWTAASGADLRLLVRHALEPVDLFASAAREQNFELILVTSPVPWQVATEDGFPRLAESIGINASWPVTQDLPQRILSMKSEKTATRFCDATAAFRTFSQPARLFLEDDRNLSRLGAALYARELAGQILSLNFARTDRQNGTMH